MEQNHKQSPAELGCPVGAPSERNHPSMQACMCCIHYHKACPVFKNEAKEVVRS